jgi:hypothetical protein
MAKPKAGRPFPCTTPGCSRPQCQIAGKWYPRCQPCETERINQHYANKRIEKAGVQAEVAAIKQAEAALAERKRRLAVYLQKRSLKP